MDAAMRRIYSTCPHDCPSTCALEIDLLAPDRIGRVRGARDNTYTAGVVCAKVARYAERIHHPNRLMHPLKRSGPRGSGQFSQISWDEALDLTANAFIEAENKYGSECVWPYFYAGTMGHVMRDGINRLRHAKRYSRQLGTICATASSVGYVAGTGSKRGVDPREMAKSDLIVIWGANAANTQVNLMSHVTQSRKSRGAKIIVIDIYENDTVKQADTALLLRPGTDGALACAIMHILFRDGHADRAYLEKYTDCPEALEAHLAARTPEWAATITGLDVQKIEALAHAIGTTKRTFLRLGYGFTRQRNGSVAMHAALSIAAVTGAWQYEGGGALFSNSSNYHLNKTLIEGLDCEDPGSRIIDMSRIGAALTGDPYDLKDGPPIKAMIIQNCNPIAVAPEQRKVKAGFARDDLFICVHEQFMTETAAQADIVLPATMFLEHDDIYTSGGHTHLQLGLKQLEPPGECRSNHDVVCALAARVGAEHRGFDMTPRELIDATLASSGWDGLSRFENGRWIDCAQDFETAHFLKGFSWPDGKFRFRPDWPSVPYDNKGFALGPVDNIPSLPDHWDVIENTDAGHPYRLATSPSKAYLNSSFTETPSSQAKHGRPCLLIHPDDLTALGGTAGIRLQVGNTRGEIVVTAQPFAGLQRGVVIVESIPPNAHFENGEGVNTLTGADQTAPLGGAAFHDNKVWIRIASVPAAGSATDDPPATLA